VPATWISLCTLDAVTNPGIDSLRGAF